MGRRRGLRDMPLHGSVQEADIMGQLVMSLDQCGESFFVAVELFDGIGEHLVYVGELLCVLFGAPF